MKRFVFKLQTLLNIKLALEKEQKAKLMECDALLNRLNGELMALENAFEQMRQAFKQKSEAGMPVSEAQSFERGFEHSKDARAQKKDEIAAAEMERLQVRLQLVEIMREIKIFENLREKQYEAYLKEVKLEEDKLIGDILSYQITTN